MIELIAQQREAIARLCRLYGVRRLDVFGSATKVSFDPQTSDLDFVVDFADRGPGYLERYLDLADALEALLGYKVDLLTERALSKRPRFRQSVEESREPIYDRASETKAA
ncbi:MAG: nucleotidyltransferase domain-containing protein [Thermomicrobiales bacterium]